MDGRKLRIGERTSSALKLSDQGLPVSRDAKSSVQSAVHRWQTFPDPTDSHGGHSLLRYFRVRHIATRHIATARVEFFVETTTGDNGRLMMPVDQPHAIPQVREHSMMNVSGTLMWTVAAAVSLSGIGRADEMPRHHRAALIRTVSTEQAILPPAPQPDAGGAELGHSSSVPPPIRVESPPLNSGFRPEVEMSRVGMLPPPGTLGRTYQQRTALVPDADHPRMGVVLVHLPEQADVSARGLKVKWTGEVWRLESEHPLVPGVPHIYAVHAEWDSPAGRTTQVRWVRLIMGREVDLKF